MVSYYPRGSPFTGTLELTTDNEILLKVVVSYMLYFNLTMLPNLSYVSFDHTIHDPHC